MNKNFSIVAAALLMVGTCASARGTIISGDTAGSTGGIGSFTGTLTYSASNASSGVLTISITNTSASGFITGVVTANSAVYGGLAVTLTSSTDSDLANTGVESGSPFGTFQGGAALGSNFLGGGSPSNGVGVGQTITLVFSVAGTGAGSLSDSSFIGYGSGLPITVVRMRGFDNGDSDKIPVIPAPGAAALMGLGVLGAARRRR